MPSQTCFLETKPPGFAARVVHGLRFHLKLASEGCNSMGVAAGFPPLAEYAFDGFGQHRGGSLLALGPRAAFYPRRVTWLASQIPPHGVPAYDGSVGGDSQAAS